MIDAGTIRASLILDTSSFAGGINGALSALAFLGAVGGEQSEKIGTLGDVLAIVGGGIYGDFQVPFLNASGTVTAVCSVITEAAEATAQGVGNSAQAMKRNMLTPLRELIPEGGSIMQNFGQGLINGLVSKQGSLMAKARSIANSVAATMKKALGIASPSRVMREVGRFTAEGMVLGMQDMNGQVEQASKALAQSAVTNISVDYAPRTAAAFEPETAFPPAKMTGIGESSQENICRKLDALIDLLSSGKQSIELDRRTFGTLIREYT